MAQQRDDQDNQQQAAGGRQQQFGDGAQGQEQQSQRGGENQRGGDGRDNRGTPAARAGASNLKQEGKALSDDMKRQAGELAEQEKGRASAYIRTVSRAILSGAQTLREDGFEGSANAVDHLAAQLGDILQNFEAKDTRQLLEGANTFARSNPVAFLSASLIAGFGMARVIKAGAQPQTQDGQSS